MDFTLTNYKEPEQRKKLSDACADYTAARQRKFHQGWLSKSQVGHIGWEMKRLALCKALFTEINADLAARGLLLRAGTLVDATLIAAPPRPRMQNGHATPRCTGPRRATSGISD